jgi:ABC-type Zn uptake system ZnuABC Zn-binding protein ZnuA
VPSPIPGINRYLDPLTVWYDVHAWLDPALAEAVAQEATDQVVVRIDALV